ncbi:fibronectin type III domain-containing protein [Brevifollis gellanilyticus]|uniref:Purple acid phosphatase N-terminal domain-containing protein n=1 Tax=Brevifollis gellanilyticus TaxID=748831 RepID=A0A512M256_9BACT|nr:fibronectin type III domain-containing protein [Brevifollis gellanilyticus]GEP40824.1 hypothetical protein BGE01nite_01150 [Brevifollis gellanilyticus]
MTRFVLTALVWITAQAAQAVELVSGPTVAQSATGAVVSWRTDVACGTRLSYGTSLTKLDQKLEGPVGAEHNVTLPGLTKGTTYYYEVGSARQKLGEGNFTLGAPAKTSAETPPKATPPKSMLEKVMDAIKPDAPKPKPDTTAPTAARAPPTRQTWGRIDSLQDHFDRHGADFQSKSPDDYAAQAWLFLQRAKAGGLPMKWDDSDQSLRVYDPKTRAFAAYNRDGTTKTYFRPNSPTYWDRQPGKLIQPAQLPFK